MQNFEVVIKAIKNLIAGLVVEGLAAIVIGILIFAMPELLGMLVGILFILTGIVALGIAIRLKKYSKIKIEV